MTPPASRSATAGLDGSADRRDVGSAAAAHAGQGRESARGSVVLQSGALAYRRRNDGELLVLLITKKRSKRWGIPKGKVEAHLSFGENAAKEAFEEAGVKGKVSRNAAGMFRASKRTIGRRGARVIEVWVYLLEVTERLAQWPEKGMRRIQWVSCDVAAARLREPVLAALCHRLGRGPARLLPSRSPPASA